VLVRPAGRFGKVARALLGILDDVGEPTVQISALAFSTAAIERRREEWVCEPECLTFTLEHAGRGRFGHRGSCIVADRSLDQGHRRLADGSGGKRCLSGGGRQPREALADDVEEARGYRQRFPGLVSVAGAHHTRRDLERVERVPARCTFELAERWPQEARPEPRSDQSIQVVMAERSDIYPLWTLDVENRPTGSCCGNDARRFVVEPAESESERACRRRVHPLHVIERDKDRLVLGQTPQESPQRGADCPQLRSLSFRFLEKERDPKRATLRRRQGAELLVRASEKVAKGRERQLSLGSSGTRLEDAETAVAGALDDRSPERRLPDSRLALEEQHAIPCRVGVQERLGEGEFTLAPEHRSHTSSVGDFPVEGKRSLQTGRRRGSS